MTNRSLLRGAAAALLSLPLLVGALTPAARADDGWRHHEHRWHDRGWHDRGWHRGWYGPRYYGYGYGAPYYYAPGYVYAPPVYAPPPPVVVAPPASLNFVFPLR
jgi:hypothetical protein